MRKIKIGIIVLLLFVAAAISGCAGNSNQSQNKTPKIIESSVPVPTPSEIQNATVTKAVEVEKVKCELCHKNAKELSPHINGGKFCINCHGSQVHNIHIGSGTVGLQCDSCHGFPPTIPKAQKGTGPGSYSVCEQCHAPPPDSLKPSNGDLIAIHLSRAKYCTNCHGNDIGKTHEAALAKANK